MPGILWIFIALGGLGVGSSLADSSAPVWGRPDRNAHNGGSYRCEENYRTWSAPQWEAHVTSPKGTCELTWFAVSNCQRRVRLMVGEEEKNLDWSWTFYSTEREGYRQQVRFRFIDPVTGKVLADQTVGVNCLP